MATMPTAHSCSVLREGRPTSAASPPGGLSGLVSRVLRAQGHKCGAGDALGGLTQEAQGHPNPRPSQPPILVYVLPK